MADLLTTRRSRAFWRSYAAAYDRLWDNALSAAVADQVIAALPAGVPVCEVGAGTGLLTARLRAGGVAVSASEPEPHMRARLAKRLPDIRIDDRTIDQVCTDGFEGVVVLANVLHLVAHPAEVLTRTRRAATGGVVVVTPTAQASLASVTRALHSHGSSAAYLARFRLLHAALAPLSAATGATTGSLDDSWLPTEHRVTTVGGVQHVAAFDLATTSAGTVVRR